MGGGLTNTVKAVSSTLYKKQGLKLGQHDSLLRLIFPFTVGVAGFTDLVGLEKDNLAESFVGVDPCRKWGGIRDFQRDEAFPLRLEGRHVDDDAATGIGTFANADGQHAAGNLEVFDRTRQGKGVGRHDANVGGYIDERSFVEMLGIDQSVVDVGKDFELVGHTQV